MDIYTYTVAGSEHAIRFHEKPTLPVFDVAGGLYIADTNTAGLIPHCVNYDPSRPLVVVPAGETNKNMSFIEQILAVALDSGLARDSLFVGFGGGVICDMAAFAASLYMRGCRLELMPTSLLAMCDAAIGGKTGIDFKNFKNCIGTFYPASTVHIATSMLDTLTETEYRSGLAEVLKTAMLYSPKLFQIMSDQTPEVLNRDKAIIQTMVRRCVQAKAKVVERDLTESGERMFLNLGHTFGHALESVAGFGTLSHGEAVAWGLGRAMALGTRLGLTDPEYARDVLSLLPTYGWVNSPVHPACTAQPENLLSAMKNDKKKRGGRIRFILQRELNSTLVQEVDDNDVLAVLA